MARPVRISDDMIDLLECRRKKMRTLQLDDDYVSIADASRDIADEFRRIYGKKKGR
jgi:hypothetical protein